MDNMNDNLYNMNITHEGRGVRGCSHVFHSSEPQNEQCDI
jgi:hypothetical protein